MEWKENMATCLGTVRRLCVKFTVFPGCSFTNSNQFSNETLTLLLSLRGDLNESRPSRRWIPGGGSVGELAGKRK